MAVPKRKTTPSRAGKRRSHIKISPKNIIEDKKLRVVPTSPKIAGFVRKNKSFKHLLPVGIKL